MKSRQHGKRKLAWPVELIGDDPELEDLKEQLAAFRSEVSCCCHVNSIVRIVHEFSITTYHAGTHRGGPGAVCHRALLP